jgi:hypothetical protein
VRWGKSSRSSWPTSPSHRFAMGPSLSPKGGEGFCRGSRHRRASPLHLQQICSKKFAFCAERRNRMSTRNSGEPSIATGRGGRLPPPRPVCSQLTQDIIARKGGNCWVVDPFPEPVEPRSEITASGREPPHTLPAIVGRRCPGAAFCFPLRVRRLHRIERRLNTILASHPAVRQRRPTARRRKSIIVGLAEADVDEAL